MAMSRVHNEDVHSLADQAFHSFKIKNTHCRTSSQTTLLVLAGVRKPIHHVDVFDRD
jgi:hypothetical protein